MEKLVSDNPVQRIRVVQLLPELANRIELFSYYIELRQQKDLAAVQADFPSGRKVDLRIQALTSAIDAEELRLLKERQDIESERAAWSAYGFAALVIFILVAVPLVYTNFRRTGRDKEKAAAQAARLVAVIDSTPDMIAMSSTEGGIAYFNSAVRNILELGDKNAS